MKKDILLMTSHRIRFNLLIVSSKSVWENICSACVEGHFINGDREHVIKNIIEVLIRNVQSGRYI